MGIEIDVAWHRYPGQIVGDQEEQRQVEARVDKMLLFQVDDDDEPRGVEQTEAGEGSSEGYS